MTEYDEEWVFPICVAFAFVIVGGIMHTGAGVLDLPETDWWDFDPNDHIEIQPHWTLAHLAVEMELFPSVSIAKKNGWDGQIPRGYTEKRNIGKMKKCMFIHNPSDAFISDSEWGKN